MAETDLFLTSCLTDQPVNEIEEDNLRAEDYADALAMFIRNAATPVTIGIQGGWGSGKTSLITMLKHKLEAPDNPQNPNAENQAPTLCVMVNAWEHSLFQGKDDLRAEVAISLLSALSEGLTKSLEEASWLGKPDSGFVKAHSEIIEKAIGGIKFGALFAGKVATQMLSNMVGGGDISNVKIEDATRSIAALPKMATYVRQLRETLMTMIDELKFKGKPVKIVFFIDDLDRVPPAIAVEILDVTKNIFDMPQCVFVLAIDYEVVVKGLENKFGPKSSENEREFRQYFDKIIQIPFTMPIGAFGDNLSDMLKKSLLDLGYSIDEAGDQVIKKLAADAKLATGGIPRSIKRILNTLSLLQHISDARQKKSPSDEKKTLPQDMEARFIVVALHVNFPELARRLMEKPDFVKWDPDELDAPWGLKYEANKPELALLSGDQLFNDPWEKVIYCLCANSSWLKSMSRSLSRLMNNLLESLGGDENDATSIPDDGLVKLKTILKGISVVSIDAAPDNAITFNTKDLEKHPTTKFFGQLQDLLATQIPDDEFPRHSDEVVNISDDGSFDYSVEGNGNIVYTEFTWSPDNNELTIYVVGYKPGNRKNAEQIIEKKVKECYRWDWEGRNFYFYFSVPFTQNDFINTQNISKIANDTLELYQDVKNVSEYLYKKLG